MEAKKVRLFWIKLDSKFFENDGVVMIESLPGGAEMLLLIMKMMVASLDKNGVWEFSELFDGINVLANRFKVSREFVANTLNAAQACGLLQVELDDGQISRIIIPMVRDLADSVTQGAIAKREERARKAALPDKGTKKAEEKAAKVSKADVDKIVAAWNATDLPEVFRVTDKRREMIAARVKSFGVDNVLKAIEKVGKSEFCHRIPEGKKEPWCNFDWLIENDTRMAKAVEGRYDNGPAQSYQGLTQDFTQYMVPTVVPEREDLSRRGVITCMERLGLIAGSGMIKTDLWPEIRETSGLSAAMTAAIDAAVGYNE